MKKLEVSQMENLQGGRPCIGTGTVTITGVNGCTTTCLQDYFLWIPVGPVYSCGEPVCGSQF